jgi:hypothetical protein
MARLVKCAGEARRERKRRHCGGSIGVSDSASDHDRYGVEDTGRAMREATLRQLAREQTGEVAAVSNDERLNASQGADHNHPDKARRRVSGRGAVVVAIALLIAVLLAGTGTFALLHARQPTTAHTPTPVAHQTPTPACAPKLPAASAASPPASTVTSNIRVSNDTYRAHSEPMVAINPANPLNLLGGSKFFTDPAHYRFQIGTYVSFDGGCSWADNGVLPGFQSNEITSDISIAYGPKNRVYVAVLYSDNVRDSGIAVLTSSDGGKTFGQPVRVFDDPTGAVFSDKPWITVDTSGGRYDGTIYVVWSYDYGGSCGYDNACKQGLAFSSSIDDGNTFSDVRQVEGEAPFCTNPARGRDPTARTCDAVLGAIPTVMPNGTLAVAFQYFDLMSSGSIPSRLAIVTSPDGGASWTSPVLIATISDIAGIFPPDRYRNDSLPAFAAGPTRGSLFIAWADKTTGDSDILFAASTDAGATWSRPVRVNDDATRNGENQFQPQLAVAPNGVVTISYFDTRRDPHHHLIDVYLAQSTDGGVTFLPSVRVTTQSWDPSLGAPVDGSGQQFIGDYQGLAVTNQYAYPFWNDSRTGSQEIFTAVAPSVQP